MNLPLPRPNNKLKKTNDFISLKTSCKPIYGRETPLKSLYLHLSFYIYWICTFIYIYQLCQCLYLCPIARSHIKRVGKEILGKTNGGWYKKKKHCGRMMNFKICLVENVLFQNIVKKWVYWWLEALQENLYLSQKSGGRRQI